ncbi:MAG: HNH endonuclease signature motif containing protein [Thermodesulfobacteriota bacterium]
MKWGIFLCWHSCWQCRPRRWPEGEVFGEAARGGGSRSSGRAGQFLANSPAEIKIPRSTVRFAPRSNYYGVSTDSDGRIVPSASAREEFLKSRGLQSAPEGYMIEHKIPLYAGGRDEPSNMQLVTRDEHRAKTRMDYQLFGK